nr:MAG TPA: hypothetical protein [Caudoviricetes sp.]
MGEGLVVEDGFRFDEEDDLHELQGQVRAPEVGQVELHPEDLQVDVLELVGVVEGHLDGQVVGVAHDALLRSRWWSVPGGSAAALGRCGRHVLDEAPQAEHRGALGLAEFEGGAHLQQVRVVEGHVLALGDLRVGRVEHEGTALLVEGCQDDLPRLRVGGVVDVDAAVRVGLDAEVRLGHALLALDPGEFERPVAAGRLRQDDRAVVALEVVGVPGLGVQGRSVLAVVADGFDGGGRCPGLPLGLLALLEGALLEEEERVVLDEFDVVGVVARGDVVGVRHEDRSFQ